MARKTTTTSRRGDASPAEQNPDQQNLNRIYTAHQVHTLAQMMFRQLSCARSAGIPWHPNGPGMSLQQGVAGQGTGMAWPMHAGQVPGQVPNAPQASVPAAPQGLVYWYP